MNSARRAVCALLALAACSCSDDPELVIVIEHPTLIEVAPEEFLGQVPCLDAPGAMQRYVATVYDVTTDEVSGTVENFPLPSSGPVACTSPIGFAFVEPGNYYAAEVQGYDRADIAPLAPGLSVMVDPNGQRVEPRWTTTCGRNEGEATLAVAEVTRRISHCEPLTDLRPSDAPTSVSVAVDCASAPAEVASYRVRDRMTGTEVSASCGASAVLRDLPSGVLLELEVLAYPAESTTPIAGALCTARTVSTLEVQATCPELAETGAVEIDLAAALSEVELACDAGLRELLADPAGDAPPQRVTPPACANQLRLGELPPGATDVNITTTLADGSAGPSLTCSAAVLPGLAVRASCHAD